MPLMRQGTALAVLSLHVKVRKLRVQACFRNLLYVVLTDAVAANGVLPNGAATKIGIWNRNFSLEERVAQHKVMNV